MRRTEMGTRTMETTAPSMRRATKRIQNPPYSAPPGAAIVTPGTASVKVPPQRVQKLAAALTAWPHWLQKTVASVMGQEYIATEMVGKWQSKRTWARAAEIRSAGRQRRLSPRGPAARNARRGRFLR